MKPHRPLHRPGLPAVPAPGLPGQRLHTTPAAGSSLRGDGFTLIEVIITLVILSVMAALTIPAFLRDPVRTDMDDAQSRLEILFRMARDSAVRSASEVTVAFDSVTGNAWLDVAAPPASLLLPAGGSAAGGGGLPLRAGGTFGGGSALGRGVGAGAGTGVGEPIGLRPGVSLQLFRARALFTFSPGGTVVGDSLVVRGPNGEARHITLEPWTGHVQVR